MDFPTLFPYLFLIACLVNFLCLGSRMYRAVIAYRSRPPIREEDIVYNEWTASGFSEASLQTRMGGARGCLRLIVTRDQLIVTTWAPLTFISTQYDMEHVVELANIKSIETKRVLFDDFLRLTFRGSDGFMSTICLLPNNRAAFLKALGTREAAQIP